MRANGSSASSGWLKGGLGLSSAEQAAAPAFLGSWALALKEVTTCVGTSSVSGFRSKCGPLAINNALAAAEAKLLQDGGGSVSSVDWIGLLCEPKAKLQSVWTAKLHNTMERLCSPR